MDCSTQNAEYGGHDNHDHGGHSHDHTHDHEDPTGESLYKYIDTSKVRSLNSSIPEFSCKPIKPYSLKHDRSTFLESNEDDPELILFIPFTEAVSVKSICISGGEAGTHPKSVKLFVNREDIDFTNASELPSEQKLELVEDFNAEIDYPLQIRKFQGIGSLTIFIEDNFDGDSTKIHYLGLKGESKKWKRGIVECEYEARPQPSDHKFEAKQGSIA